MRARRAAADALRVHLASSFAEAPDACHVLIAHSHGGVVAFDAVTRDESIGNRQLDGILSLGTPYLAVEEDTGNQLKLLLFSLYPTAVGVFVGALLAALTGAGDRHAAVWLASMIAGFSLCLDVVPRLMHHPIARTVTDVLFAASLLIAVWAAIAGLAPLATSPGLPVDLLSGWHLALRSLLVLLTVSLSAAVLLASRISAVQGGREQAYLLRDTMTTVRSMAKPLTICCGIAWALWSVSPWAKNFLACLLFWPYASLGVVYVLQSGKGFSARSLTFWRTLQEQERRRVLPCALHALRLPGDEASLAIAASLIARQVADLFGAAISWPLTSEKFPRWLIAPLALLGVGMVGFCIRQMKTADLSGWRLYVLGATLGLFAFAAVLVIIALMLVVCLFVLSMLTTGLLAMAVGPEVDGFMPAARVDCEPLPRCEPADRYRLEIYWVGPTERADLSLRHSLYNLDSVRKGVADWIALANARRFGATTP